MSAFEFFKPKPKTPEPPNKRIQEAKEKPRIICYEDEWGDSHEIVGILETPALSHRFLGQDIQDLQGIPHDFWYINREGKRIKVKNARSWQYDWKDESKEEKAERIKREVEWQEKVERVPESTF